MLREKIHHLDDMLKSQQRKVRQMIEQVRGVGLAGRTRRGRRKRERQEKIPLWSCLGQRIAGPWGCVPLHSRDTRSGAAQSPVPRRGGDRRSKGAALCPR